MQVDLYNGGKMMMMVMLAFNFWFDFYVDLMC